MEVERKGRKKRRRKRRVVFLLTMGGELYRDIGQHFVCAICNEELCREVELVGNKTPLYVNFVLKRNNVNRRATLLP